jgi:CubicO group peptidase (beta-lactamase class C family)
MRNVFGRGLAALLLAATTPSFAAPATADTVMKSAAGVALTVPKAWDATRSGNMTVVTAPEGDLKAAIVDVGKAADAKAAAAAAWTVFRPAANRPFKLATPRAAKDGWDERAVVDYETSPNEKVAVYAVAYRKGDAWTVAILEGAEATAAKRGAALNLISASIRPAGYARESFAGKTANRMDPARVEALRSFVADAMKKLNVPGAGLAIIDQGKVVYEGGIGVRELGKSTPVDAHTKFMIASNTKGMSTLLLSRLVDAGKLKWDDPVVKVYPSFRLGNDATTRQVLVRHLVCACTGLPRKDLEWLINTPRTTPASATFTSLAATQPTSGFGEVYQYNNIMASAAGYIGGHLVHPKMELGKAYDAAMQSMIFDPLGMKETTMAIGTATKGNFASPHGDDLGGKVAVMPMDFNYTVYPYRPAGAAWSSAHDMIKYVALELSEGKLPDGTQLVSAENLLARRAHGVSEGEDHWYGMGLSDDRSWGVSVVHHGGSMFGYKSDWVAIPEAGVGAVLLTNSENGGYMLRPFVRRVLEILYDGKPEAVKDIDAAAARLGPELAKFRERLVAPPAADVTAGLAKTYANPDLGRLTVRPLGKDMVFAVTSGWSRVASRKNDDGTISMVAIDPALIGFEWVVGTKDGKPALTARDSQHEYVFVATGS